MCCNGAHAWSEVGSVSTVGKPFHQSLRPTPKLDRATMELVRQQGIWRSATMRSMTPNITPKPMDSPVTATCDVIAFPLLAAENRAQKDNMFCTEIPSCPPNHTNSQLAGGWSDKWVNWLVC